MWYCWDLSFSMPSTASYSGFLTTLVEVEDFVSGLKPILVLNFTPLQSRKKPLRRDEVVLMKVTDRILINIVF